MERRDIKRSLPWAVIWRQRGRVEAKHLRNLHVSYGG
jgi:hypothetical protein